MALAKTPDKKRAQKVDRQHMSVEPVLELQNVSAGYPDRTVLRDVTFRINRGELLCVIGPNGGGKSTLLATIAGRIPALSGSILLEGKQAPSSVRERARLLSVLYTDRFRGENMTAREVVASGRYPWTGYFGRLECADREILQDVMRELQLTELAEQPFSLQSDGTKQRILIARALCQSPQILLLDEPLVYLDLARQLELVRCLRNRCRKDGLTVLMSVHDPQIARQISDRVITVSRQGEVRLGRPEEIFTEEIIRDLYQLPPDSYDPRRGIRFSCSGDSTYRHAAQGS